MLAALRTCCIGFTIALSGCSQHDEGREQTASDKVEDTQIGKTEQQAVAPYSPVRQNRDTPRDFQANEYPGGAFIVTDFGSPPRGDAAAAIARLEPIAKSGNAKASYEIYLKLDQCLSEINDLRAQQARPSAISPVEDCHSLEPDDYAKASEWLSLAAEQGSLGAQLVYASNPEVILGNPSEMLRSPASIETYKERSNSYLRAAAARGSVDALSALGDAYLNGIMVEQDLTTSYAYQLAISKIDPELNSRRRTEYFNRSLTASQIVEANIKSQEILNECCNGRAR